MSARQTSPESEADESTLLLARQDAQAAGREVQQAVERIEDYVEYLFADDLVQAESARQTAVSKLESALKIINSLPHLKSTGAE